MCLLFFHSKSTHYCKFILCSVTLVQLLMVYRKFLVPYLGYFLYISCHLQIRIIWHFFYFYSLISSSCLISPACTTWTSVKLFIPDFNYTALRFSTFRVLFPEDLLYVTSFIKYVPSSSNFSQTFFHEIMFNVDKVFSWIYWDNQVTFKSIYSGYYNYWRPYAETSINLWDNPILILEASALIIWAYSDY